MRCSPEAPSSKTITPGSTGSSTPSTFHGEPTAPLLGSHHLADARIRQSIQHSRPVGEVHDQHAACQGGYRRNAMGKGVRKAVGAHELAPVSLTRRTSCSAVSLS
jgi:hypothetical protein